MGKDSGWIIDSVLDHTISISKYNPLAGNSYVKLPKELDRPKKGLINTQNKKYRHSQNCKKTKILLALAF